MAIAATCLPGAAMMNDWRRSCAIELEPMAVASYEDSLPADNGEGGHRQSTSSGKGPARLLHLTKHGKPSAKLARMGDALQWPIWIDLWLE